MTRRISLCLVIHNHQPVGNFGWVVEELWRVSYAPLIAALERHPSVRMGLHYSGPLLDWMEAERPEGVEKLRALVARDQVEMLGGGLYEPILVSLPAADRNAQLKRLSDRVEGVFGRRPRGAWLAERVWEPSLASDLVDGGYSYTVVDDNHLRGARVAEDAMWGTYSTDDQGRRLTLFGTEQGLRYRIPWKPVADVIGYLRRHATEGGERLGVMGDDGEKFGGWPGTHELCWGRNGWIERLFRALESNRTWLSTVRPSDWLDQRPPIGRIYVPASSYVEMTEWALPPDEANVFHQLLERARASGDPAARFLFGALWRNFQAKYREVNDLHKHMLRVSDQVALIRQGRAHDRAADHLHRGQSNDVYWHGLFGGVYLVHLRLATQAHLIAAEDLADRGQPRTRLLDADLDGTDEAIVGAPGQSLLVDLAEGAGIGAWDLRATRLAMGSVLRRRPEAYHEKLRQHLAGQQSRARVAKAAKTTAQTSGRPVVLSPHETIAVKAEGLAALLVYDRHELRGGLVTLRDQRAARALGPAELAAVTDDDLGDFTDRPFEVLELSDGLLRVRRAGSVRRGRTRVPLVVEKTYRLEGRRRRPRLATEVRVSNPGAAEVAVELDVSFAWNVAGGGHNPAAFYEWTEDGEPRTAPHDTPGDLTVASALAFGNTQIGVRVEAALSKPGRITWYPIETVSNSEAGFESVYQGSRLHLRWPLQLAPGADEGVSVTFDASQTRDLTAEEAG